MTENPTFDIRGGTCTLEYKKVDEEDRVYLQPTIYLHQGVIPPTIFKDVIQGYINNVGEVTYVCFGNIYIHYKIINFNLMGSIRGHLRERLKTPSRYDDQLFDYMISEFFPKFDESTVEKIDLLQKKVKVFYGVMRKGTSCGYRYVLPEVINPSYSFSFMLSKTINIKEDMKCTIKVPPPETDGDVELITNELIERFKHKGINLVIL